MANMLTAILLLAHKFHVLALKRPHDFFPHHRPQVFKKGPLKYKEPNSDWLNQQICINWSLA